MTTMSAGLMPEQASAHAVPAVARVPPAGVAGARHAANVAASAFPRWSATGPGERRRLLDRAAAVLESRGEDIIRAIAGETGGTRAWGELNVKLGASILREAASQTTRIAGEIVPADRPGLTSMTVRQPCGVVLSMAPWNAPVVLGIRGLATPLACGNTVVFKASELCPGVHGLIGEVFAEAGFPDGVVSILHNAESGATDMVEALVAHPAVRRVNFTGSTRAGRIIAAICARHLKKCLLELGGKAPFIVLDDADIGEAARAAAYGAFFNQGQLCMSTERLIVQEQVAEAFTARLREHALSLAQDEAGSPGARFGRMIGEQAAARVKGLVDDALRRGARLVAGGGLRGAWLEPTVLDGVTSDMRVYHEETFGPVASIIRYAEVDEAVSIANDTEYGLAAAVFGRDVSRALDVARRLETGICHVNGSTVHDEPQMPFGGMKSSGWGRFGGQAGIEEFTELRWITIQDGKQDYPI